MPPKKDLSKKPLKRDSVKELQFNFVGVSLTANKTKFHALLYVKGHRFDLGVFNTEIQAKTAYDKAKRKYERIFK